MISTIAESSPEPNTLAVKVNVYVPTESSTDKPENVATPFDTVLVALLNTAAGDAVTVITVVSSDVTRLP